GQVVWRCLVAQAVALVDYCPQRAGLGLPSQAYGIAQTVGKDMAPAVCKIDLVDSGPALLSLHAVLRDIAGRADPDEELQPIRAWQQAARPMPAGLELGQLPPRRSDTARPRGVGKGNNAIGVADIESFTQQRHAERLVQSLEKHLLGVCHTIAIRIAQQRDPIRADPNSIGASHRA